MAGSCWRLLAVCVLIFITSILAGQDGAADRSAADGRVVVPILAPHLLPRRDPPASAPIWIPAPRLPRSSLTTPANPGLPQDVFQQLIRTAGIIFSGRVQSVGHATPVPRAGTSSTTITFLVEHAILGTSAGENLTIHEWGGLWQRGERYRVGEHVLLFLYAPSKLGLTSPVAGTLGRFAVDSRGMIVMSPQHIPSFATNPILGGKTVIPYADFAVAVRRVQPGGMNEP
jgi:hypothetical protein